MTITLHPWLVLAAVFFIVAMLGTTELIHVNVTLSISAGLLAQTLHGIISFDRGSTGPK